MKWLREADPAADQNRRRNPKNRGKNREIQTEEDMSFHWKATSLDFLDLRDQFSTTGIRDRG
jgi:hypothetical protein